jgi:hypothetical protein
MDLCIRGRTLAIPDVGWSVDHANMSASQAPPPAATVAGRSRRLTLNLNSDMHNPDDQMSDTFAVSDIF